MKRHFSSGLILFICIVLLPWRCAEKSKSEVNLSPANWPEGELAKYVQLNQSYNTPKPPGAGTKGIVVGTSGALAVRAGLEALKQGGSAADAAMVTSLAQNVLTGGSEISFAGIMTMVYYEAASGQVYSMNAAYNTVKEEKDPLSIPPLGTPSGRSAPVPGFMAGVQAAHKRFGKIPFAKLFEPAIYFAEKGFDLDSNTYWFMDPFNMKKNVLTRFPETMKIFTKENGEFYKEGDLFKQPALAETLRKVATQGAEYMYKGEWARKLVEAVQKDGGKMTLEDLGNYNVIWSDPDHTTYRDYDIYILGSPSFGGLNTVEALNLLELVDLPKLGHYTTSPESLFWFIQLSRTSYYLNEYLMNNIPTPPEVLKKYFPGIDLSPESRKTKDTSQKILARLQELKGWRPINGEVFRSSEPPHHSAAVVAVDKEGNVAAVLHSINTLGWGTTGIFIDGISIPDSFAIQQGLVAKTGPGNRMSEPTNPLIVIKNGKPVLASSSIGVGLHEVTLQNLINILDFGMDPKKSVDTPKFGVPGSDIRDPQSPSERKKQFVKAGDFSEEIIEALRSLGQELKVVAKSMPDSLNTDGFWVGIQIDPETRKLLGGVDALFNGYAEGY